MNRLHWGLPLLYGALLPLAFAPFEQVWLAPLLLALLFHRWSRCRSWRSAALTGFAFGLGFFGVGVSWVYISIRQFGGVGDGLSLLVTVLFVAGLSLFIALQGGVSYSLRGVLLRYRFGGRESVFPLLWVLFEWLRSHLLGGFPWLLLGHTAPGSPYQGVAPWVGTYGVSLFLAWIGLLLMVLVRERTNRVVLIALLSLLFVGWGSGQYEWGEPSGEPLAVALVQGNIAQRDKWRPENLASILTRYREATEAAASARLVIWPETAIPSFRQSLDTHFLSPLSLQLAAEGRSLLSGIPLVDERELLYRNGLILIGEESGEYHKRHLVPLGEYLPLREWLKSLLGFVDIPLSDFSAGVPKQPLMVVANHPLSTTICYEVAYPDLAFTHYPEVDLLVTISNDGWFGDSIAPHQHLQIARMRALESARPMLRATNTGITAVIDARGRVVRELPQSEFGVLEAVVQPRRGVTPYLSWLTSDFF
ncbi:MAG: apolipoprotein N-acyltransferase [Gammaproteobacteria bacterium]|jgi:apolipoprotein N-acyltransferase|nr:apolipoprotein N-acyltransferase [Gammaproteobacteria bacterium]MBT7307203.1 apolipoprotein N-acyltransferase [Gammaproteobacteria bacterium]